MRTYFTSHQVARLLQVSPSAVVTWIDDGTLPAYRTPGGHRRVSRKNLTEFLEAHRMPVPAALRGIGRLLVVDRDANFLKTTQRTLRRRAPDMEVDTARRALEALLKIGASRPEAVLMSTSSGVDAAELSREMRSLQGLDNVRVIVVDAKASRQLEERLLAAGVSAVFKKPLDVEALLDELGHAARG